MISLNNMQAQKLQAALSRAESEALEVQVTSTEGYYMVKSSNGYDVYGVYFYETAAGVPVVECTCQGHMRGLVCKHVAAAKKEHEAREVVSNQVESSQPKCKCGAPQEDGLLGMCFDCYTATIEKDKADLFG